MDRQLQTGSYHVDHGEGQDYYDVGRGRGAGGLGIWFDNKLWTSRNFACHEILDTGGDVARFAVDYAPWPVDVGRTVAEHRTITLALGSSFTRMVSTITSSHPEPLPVAIGIGKRKTAAGTGTLTQNAETGLLAFQEPDDPAHGSLAIALRVDPRLVAGFVQDADNYLVLLNVTPGEPIVYHVGSAWDRGLDFPSLNGWLDYASNTPLDFTSLPGARLIRTDAAGS